MRESENNELIGRAQRGDSAAMGELYLHYADAIYRYVYYRTSDEKLSEDLTSETFLRMVEGIRSYEPRGIPFSAWLYRIARARLIDHWRRKNRRRTQLLDDTLVTRLADPDDAFDKLLDKQSLALLLQELTDDQQEVIILKFVEGLSNAEVSNVLGKTEGAVKSLQHRALRRLARAMETDENPETG